MFWCISTSTRTANTITNNTIMFSHFRHCYRQVTWPWPRLRQHSEYDLQNAYLDAAAIFSAISWPPYVPIPTVFTTSHVRSIWYHRCHSRYQDDSIGKDRSTGELTSNSDRWSEIARDSARIPIGHPGHGEFAVLEFQTAATATSATGGAVWTRPGESVQQRHREMRIRSNHRSRRSAHSEG